MKLREGNVFTPVCDSVHRGGSLSGGGLYPGGLCPGESLSRGFLSSGISVQWSLCHGDPRTVKQWAVRILLECILV